MVLMWASGICRWTSPAPCGPLGYWCCLGFFHQPPAPSTVRTDVVNIMCETQPSHHAMPLAPGALHLHRIDFRFHT